MAIRFTSVKCPECSASLSFEEGREKMYCSYCGTQILSVNEIEHTYRHVDEADVKRAETERLIYLKELELTEKEDERTHKRYSTAFKVAGAIAIIGALIEIVDPYNMLGIFMIEGAAIIALFSFMSWDNHKDKKKKGKRRAISPNEVIISENMSDCEGDNYNSVVARYRSAGFSNIQAIPLNDLNIFSAKKNGQVESVSINGDDDFDEGDIFQKEASVVITYHSTR